MLDGPVYVERVALYDNKRPTRAKRAIRNALEMQVAGKGFAFVEVLAECPLHLGLEPDEAEDWVRDCMEPIFPLGIKKDIADGAAFPSIPTPTFDPERVLRAVDAPTERPPRFAEGFPSHIDTDDNGRPGRLCRGRTPGWPSALRRRGSQIPRWGGHNKSAPVDIEYTRSEPRGGG